MTSIREQLFEYRYGLLSEEEAAALKVRIDSEPKIAAEWAKVNGTTKVFSDASRVKSKKPFRFGESRANSANSTGILNQEETDDQEDTGTNSFFTGVFETGAQSPESTSTGRVSAKNRVDSSYHEHAETEADSSIPVRFSGQFQGINRFVSVAAICLMVFSVCGVLVQKLTVSSSYEPLRVQVIGPSVLSNNGETLNIDVTDISGNPRQVPVKVRFFDDEGNSIRPPHSEKTESNGNLKLPLELPLETLQNRTDVQIELTVGEKNPTKAQARLQVLDTNARNSELSQNFLYANSKRQSANTGYTFGGAGVDSGSSINGVRPEKSINVSTLHYSRAGHQPYPLTQSEDDIDSWRQSKQKADSLSLERGRGYEDDAREEPEDISTFQPLAAPTRPSQERRAMTARGAPFSAPVDGSNVISQKSPGYAERKVPETVEVEDSAFDAVPGDVAVAAEPFSMIPQAELDPKKTEKSAPAALAQDFYETNAGSASRNRQGAIRMQQRVLSQNEPLMLDIESAEEGVPMVVVATQNGSQLGQSVLNSNRGNNIVELSIKNNDPGPIQIKVYDVRNAPPQQIDKKYAFVRPERYLKLEQEGLEVLPNKETESESLKLKLRVVNEEKKPTDATLTVSVWEIPDLNDEKLSREADSLEKFRNSNGIPLKDFLNYEPNQARNDIFAEPSSNLLNTFGKMLENIPADSVQLAELDDAIAEPSEESDERLGKFLDSVEETDSDSELDQDDESVPLLVFDNHNLLLSKLQTAELTRKTNPVLLGFAILGIGCGIVIGITMLVLFFSKKISGSLTFMFGMFGTTISLLICIGLYRNSFPDPIRLSPQDISLPSYGMHPVTEDGSITAKNREKTSARVVDSEAVPCEACAPEELTSEMENHSFGTIDFDDGSNALDDPFNSNRSVFFLEQRSGPEGKFDISFERDDPKKANYVEIDAIENTSEPRAKRVGSARLVIPPTP